MITKSFKRWNAAPAFTPDGSLLALAQARDEIRFIDPDTGRQAVSLTLAGPRTIDSVAFSKAGAYLAVRRTDLVQLWDLRSLARQLKAMRLEWPASLGAEKEMPPLPAKAVVHDADGAMTVWEETGEPQRIAAVLAAKGAEEPADAGGFAGRGIQRATAKQYEEAILDLTRAIELQSDNDDCWRWRGWSHHALGQIPQAIADYSQYLRRRPRDRETWDRLAACHAESGDLAQAAVDTRQAIEAGGDVAESLRHYVLVAIARRSMDDYRWACGTLLARAGSPKPGDSLTYRRQLVWACTLEVEAEPLSAALEIARADAGKPGRARDYDLAEGALLYRAGRIHDAIGILQAALSEKSLSTAQAVYGWLFLARALQQAGESAGAYQALDKAKNAGQTASTALSWCHDLELRLLQSAIDEMAATFESGEKPPAGEIKPDRPSTPAG